MASAATARGCRPLDAPVSGGDRGAREGTLTIMVGGAQKDYDFATPLFAAMGKTIVYQGAAGAGQHTKMVNQITFAGIIQSLSEAMRFAQAADELSRRYDKPILTATELAVADPENAGPVAVRASGRLCYASGNRAVTALGHLYRYAEFRRTRGFD